MATTRGSFALGLSSHIGNKCQVGVSFGDESNLYSFPDGHPLNNSRTTLFASSLMSYVESRNTNTSITHPAMAKEEDVTLFHEKEYVEFVRASSKRGGGYLDYGDTPSFKGVYEASLYTVGSTLEGLRMVMQGKVSHFFNPIGGLHHARRDRAGGFCVFNDAACAIEKALRDYRLKNVAYVDIDAHHGDGVYYGFESNKHVIIGDTHEDGRFLYPGTGGASETGEAEAKGTKLNFPLRPGSGDGEFIEAFDKIVNFVRGFKPEFIFLQCGADGLAGDPLTHLQYSSKAHAHATSKLHTLAHEICEGRILAMGGGGYNPRNVESAWMAVTKGLGGF